jgi:hypothetical protein
MSDLSGGVNPRIGPPRSTKGDGLAQHTLDGCFDVTLYSALSGLALPTVKAGTNVLHHKRDPME